MVLFYSRITRLRNQKGKSNISQEYKRALVFQASKAWELLMARTREETYIYASQLGTGRQILSTMKMTDRYLESNTPEAELH